jgi:DNA invertase Pin-like site-specific DNA recombinase
MSNARRDRERREASEVNQSAKAHTETPFVRARGNLAPGDRTFLAARVSTRWQRGNLRAQITAMKKEVLRQGAKVVGRLSYVANGSGTHYRRVFKKARAAGASVVLFATPNRVLRGDHHANVLRAAKGLRVVTLCDPVRDDAGQERYLARLGRRIKGKGGRPRTRRPGYKKDRKDELLPKVLRLRNRGRSHRQIAVRTGVPYSTVGRWLRDVA